MLSIGQQCKTLRCGRGARPSGLRNARNIERAKPVRHDRQPRGIEVNQGRFKGQAPAVRSRLARTNLDLGRARWMRGNAERMNGKAKCLSDRNTFYIYDTDERGSGLEENLRLSSLIPAYSCLFPLNGRKMFEAPPSISGVWSFGPGSPRRRRTQTAYPYGVFAASSAGFRACGFVVLSSTVFQMALGTGKSPEPLECPRYGAKSAVPAVGLTNVPDSVLGGWGG